MKLTAVLNNLLGPAPISRGHVAQALAAAFHASPTATDAAVRFVIDEIGKPILTRSELELARKLVEEHETAAKVHREHGLDRQRSEELKRREATADAAASGEMLPKAADTEREFREARTGAADAISRAGKAAIELWVKAARRAVEPAQGVVESWLRREIEAANKLGVPIGHSSAALAIAAVPDRLKRDADKLEKRGVYLVNVRDLFRMLGLFDPPVAPVMPVEPQRVAAPEENQPPPPPRIDQAEALAAKERRKAELAKAGIIKLSTQP